ncbi:phosphodiesterase [Blastococcus deserti]|uniref:Phosphodiesterase n=1 Tax=Blastococcus deserti TaxID=2259033 RepID=A0ABW4X3M5_9ACTN
MRTGTRLVGTLARGAGQLVAVPLGGIARWRGGKPMHPRGAVFDAVLERRGGSEDWGIPWLDAHATDAAVVRLSRGAGLPAPLPDLLGMAIRLPGDDGPIDLLLSTTGSGPIGRLLPLPRRDTAAVYSSIMAYRSDAGSVRLAALPEADDVPSDPRPLAGIVVRDGLRFTLAAARGTGPWQPFATLVLTAPAAPLDPDVRFDAVQNPPPGLVPDGPMARFRAPAYARARSARTADR